MRRLIVGLVSTMFVLAVAPGTALASDESRGDDENHARKSGADESDGGGDRRVVSKIYIPPARGATRTRTGGGTRGITPLPRLVALVPDHVALTARPSPSLGWFVSRDAGAPLVLTLLRDDAIEPELEVTLSESVRAGIGEASLAQWGVELEPGVVYTWSVALVADPAHRERDVVAGGAIERVAASAPPAASEGASGGFRALAADGLWYDALAELAGEIAGGNDALRAERAALLDEVDLGEVADFDRAAR